MNVTKAAVTILATRVLAVFIICCVSPLSAKAAPQPTATQSNQLNDSNPGTAGTIRINYGYRNPAAAEQFPSQFGGSDVVDSQGKSQGPGTVIHSTSGPVQMWPVMIPTAVSKTPTLRDQSIMKDMFQTFGYPVSDTQFQLIQRYNHNRLLEKMFDPERWMWTSTTTAGMQATSAANSAANMTTNQAQSAIAFTKSYLTNFTAEAGNRWQKIRDQLFIPMAILLLLPGAVMAQAKAVVAQGSPILGDTNPFEGILRSIVAVFLIPATFLVINYGIDVSNSITYTIADEYHRIFGSDMYNDANCAVQRAFPNNTNGNNDNAIMASEQPPQSQGSSAWAQYEAMTFNLHQKDPCAGLDKVITPDERVRDARKIGRLLTNGGNVAMSGMWNVMCAFQMAFLYYLWCMGPIAAALWVWPISKLRQALPSWIEGVITLCFWSLFWNTTVLLMACFRGVGDSGTIIMSALLFLANCCVKYAFDFSSLVSNGAASGVGQAMQNAMQQAQGAAGGGSKGGAPGAAGGAQPGAPGSKSATASTAHVGTGGLSPQAQALNNAYLGATNSNNSSGLIHPSTAVTPGHGIPPTGGATAALTAAHIPGSPTGGTPVGGAPAGGVGGGGGGVGGDSGLPPSAGGAFSAPGAPLSGFSAPGSFSQYGLGGTSSFTGGSSGLSFTGAPSSALSSHALNGAHNANLSNLLQNQGLGLHINPDGSMQLNQNAMSALHNLEKSGQLDPNSPQGQQISAALQAMQNGDPSQLQALTGNAQSFLNANVDPQTQAQLASMVEHGGGLSPQDTGALASFLNGQGGISVGADGTLLNSNTGDPLHFASNAIPADGLNISAIDPSTGLPAGGSLVPPVNGPGDNINAIAGMTGDPMLARISADGQPIQGLNGVEPPPTNGLAGLAQNEGGGNLSFVDANGNALPANAFDANGNPLGGVQPGSDVYAMGAAGPVAEYNPTTHEWSAYGSNGQVTLDSATGQWTAGQGGAPLSYADGQWYAQGTNGNIAYDNASGTLASTQTGAPVTYDQSSGNYYAAGTDNSVFYNSANSQFETSTSGAPVTYDSTSGNYYAANSNGNIMYDTQSQQFEVAGTSMPVNYDSSSNSYTAAGGQIYYDQSSSSFETQGSNIPVVADPGSGQWYAANTGGQISYDQTNQSFDVAGTNIPVNYDSSSNQFYADQGQVLYDNQSQRFEAAGSGAPVTPDSSGTWYAAGSNNTLALDSGSGNFVAQGSGAPVTYNDSNGYYYAAGSNDSIAYNTQAGGFVGPGGAPVVYDSGDQTYYAAGSNGNVFYDAQSNQWEAQTNQGNVAYNYDSQAQQWAPQSGSTADGAVYQASYDNWGSSSYSTYGGDATSYAAYAGDTSSYTPTYNDGSSVYNGSPAGGTYAETSYNQGAPVNLDGATYNNPTGGTYVDASYNQGSPSYNLDGSTYNNPTGGTYVDASYNQGSPSYNLDGSTYNNATGGTYVDTSYSNPTGGTYVDASSSNPTGGTYVDASYNQGSPVNLDGATYTSNPTGGTYVDAAYTGGTNVNLDGGSNVTPSYNYSDGGIVTSNGLPANFSDNSVQPTYIDGGQTTNLSGGGVSYPDQGATFTSASYTTDGAQSYAQASYSGDPGSVISSSGSYDYPAGYSVTSNDPNVLSNLTGADPGAGDPNGTAFGSTGSGVGDWGDQPGQEFLREATTEAYGAVEGGEGHYHNHVEYSQDPGETTLHGGVHANPEHYLPSGSETSYSGHSPSGPAPHSPPPQPRLGAIVPPVWAARRPSGTPSHKPPAGGQHQRPAQSDVPEPPKHKKGPLDIGAKQGGYVTDDEKKRRQKELLREAWAEYQEGQGNPSEEEEC